MSQHEREEHSQQQSDITSLQENFSKQQEKISALKKLVRKSEAAHGKSTSSTQEKVKNIALRLTNLKSKARSRQNLDSSSTSLNDSQFQSNENLHQSSTTTDAGGGTETPHRSSSMRVDTPGSEKILLLRKQMEENKVKMAERENSKREIEHMVTQLKAKFDTTQQCLEHSSELGRSMGDLSALSYSSVKDKVRSATDLASAPFNLDKERIKFLDNRVRLLEKQLEKEKSSSDASKKVKELENKILELEENLKEKRTRDLVATLNDHEVEETWQIENDRLKTELEEKTKKILHLEEVNDVLETAKCDLTEKTQELETKLRESQEKGEKLEKELEKLKSSLDSQKFQMVEDADLESRVEQELTTQIQQLEAKIKELEQENEELRQENENIQEQNDEQEHSGDKTDSLEATIESQREDILNHIEKIKSLEEELMEKTIELNVLNANFAVLEEKLKVPSRKPLFATMSYGEVSTLKDQLDATTKKAKQLEKQLYEFKRLSDLHATVAELTEENEELQQKITELEDEKGQLQLKLVSGEHTTIVTEIEIEKKIEYLEATCQNQTSAIQLLEEQKMDMSENLESTKSELESARVVCEMESIQLEEQVSTNLQKIEELQKENSRLNKTVEELRAEKISMATKMDHYVAENMELLDKIEKLSKSSSSAESIEIVERLTQQDRLEIEAFNKRVEQEEAREMNEGSRSQQQMDPELSDSLLKLKEESSELMHKIELFTTERKEVLEKMEALTAENQEHLKKIEQLSDEKLSLERSNDEANIEKVALKRKFEDANEEKEAIKREIREMSAEKNKITAELNKMIKASSINVPNDGKDLIDKCEKSLAKLNTELETYRKANDKNAKFNASKKLSKEAKNSHQQLTELLEKIKSASSAPQILEVDDGKLTEMNLVIQELREKLSIANSASEEKDNQITRLNKEIESMRTMSEEFDSLINDKEMAHEKQIENLTRLRRELEAKIETSEAEMKILQELIAEQKQQLIEAYTDSETELSKKMEELNKRDEEITFLKSELKTLQENSGQVSQQFSADLEMEVEKLREALSINKGLLAEQIDELTNKQETIDTLNAQIMELYKTMEENADKVIEKEDEIASIQEQLDTNKIEMEKLSTENENHKQIADKLLLELQSQKIQLEKLSQISILEENNAKLKEENQTLEENLQISEVKMSQLERTVKDLEQRNKEQLEKLKKVAANLKKKVAQCNEYEARVKNLEKGALDAEAKEKNPAFDALQEEVQEKTKQLQLLEAQTSKQREYLEECVQKAQNALDLVQSEVMELREQLYQKNNEIDELKLALQEKDKTLGNESEFLRSQLRLLQEQLQSNQLKIQEFSMKGFQSDGTQDEIRKLHNLLNEKNAKIDELLEQIQESEPLTEELKKLQSLIDEKNARIDELNEQLLDTDSGEVARNLHNLLNEKNAKIDELNDQLLESETTALLEQLHEKETAIKELNLQIHQLQENNLRALQFGVLGEQVDSTQDEVRNLRNQIDEKNAKINELIEQIQKAEPLAEEVRKLQNLLNERNAKITEHNDQVLQSGTTALFEQLKEKDTAIHELNAQVDHLTEQINSNSQLLSQLTIIREDLNAKEKEIEKQNKILDSTEEQLNLLQEEMNEKNQQIKELSEQVKRTAASSNQTEVSPDVLKEKDAKIEELTKEFKAKSLKFEKSKAVIKEKNREIQRLNQLLSKEVEEEHIVQTSAPSMAMSQPPSKTIQSKVEELQKENARILEQSAVERATFQETISRLETVHDGIQAKLQEDMSYIETLEHENNNFKEKISRLEECVATFEDRRASMERRANLLNAQLQTRVDEHTKAEDELVYRLNMLSDHDDIIGQRLFEAQEENELLSNRLETLKAEHATLVANHAKLEKEFASFKDLTSNNIESENHLLKTKVQTLETEMKRLRSHYETQLTAKESEIDQLENDLSEQLRVINEEKRSLTEELERAKDGIIELSDERVRLNEALNSLEQSKADLERESTWIKLQMENLSHDQFELQELRMQSMQDKNEQENLKHQIETLAQNHEIELNALRTQIAELDSMRMQVGQNQTDDQVFIETENKRLTDLLAEKESLIENYQRQNLQLQMNALAARQQTTDPFASNQHSDDSAQMANLIEKCNRLERELNEKQREIEQLRTEQQMVVPPPVAFFGTEQSTPSAFDEIASVRYVDNLHGAIQSHPNTLADESVGNQQTIEDLQRNVSDLEKHATDLENKLAHRIAAHEDSLRQLNELRRNYEVRMKEYEDRIKDLELKEAARAIESQIITPEQAPSLDMFFRGPSEPSPFESIVIPQVSTEPVIEEVIVPKTTYSCHPAEQLELDEGWGWGSEEAALEAKHFAATSSSSLIPPHQQMELKLQESLERIQELELERDRLEQQKQEMQVKSGKLMKKLKEYKTKIDELYSQSSFRKSSSVESSDLDAAIQEEMKSQIKQLEEKLAEAKKQNDGQALEKENLLKRIDVLTAGNERMIEMKDRQDNDAQMYKSRIRELTEKVKKLEEWGTSAEASAPAQPAPEVFNNASEELEKSKAILQNKIQELLHEIEDISGDRTELQALLDEEKANVQRAEQEIKVLQEKLTRLENSAGSDSSDQKFHMNEIKLENQNLKLQLNDAQEAMTREKNERLEEINRLMAQSVELSTQISQLQAESVKAKELEVKLEQTLFEKNNLIQEIEALRMQLTFAPQATSPSVELETQIIRLNSDLESVIMQNQDLGREVERLRNVETKSIEELNRLTSEVDSVTKKNSHLMQEIDELKQEKSISEENGKLSQEVNRLQTELQSMEQRNEQLSAEINRIQLESTFSSKSDGNFLETERLTSQLQMLTSENEKLTKEIETLRLENEKSQKEIDRFRIELPRFHTTDSSSATQLNELEEKIQEKDSEIMHLKQRIEDLMREDQTEKLVLEILTKNQEIHLLKMQVKNLEDDKQEIEHNLALQITQEMNNKRADDSAEKIQQLQAELENMRIEKSHMEEELQVLNNHVMSSLENEEKMKTTVLELDMKNIEIAELRKSLQTIKSQETGGDLATTTAQWEGVVDQRCSEIAELWRKHLESREEEFKQIQTKLQGEIDALKTGNTSEESVNVQSSFSSKEPTPDLDIQKMQEVLESQEIEIVTLKEQLAIRSAEYARLAAQFDPFQMQSTMSHSSGFSSDRQKRPDTSSLVPKSELDLTLYMLHQRDMRIEELKLELVHLLEERDTLQLKLSNALRQIEMINSQGAVEVVEPSQGEQSVSQESPKKDQANTSIFAQPVTDELNQKLFQLQSVNHSKDKSFQEERDQRIRQMVNIQQDVARMPSEALSELVGSDFAQSSQSPSSVLLNWLWGKSGTEQS